ncbi:MAG: hypothetical protein HOW97_28975 [Catenulispora sp.]|nr:hypothetical protein [Catenulispora sp.]
MFVRTLYITADPADVGAALDVIAKAVPGMLAEQAGFQGIGIFADRALGKIATGSWWESEQALKDSDARLRDRRMEMLAPFVSTIAAADLEAVAYSRPAAATTGGFRLQRMMFDPAQADRIVRAFQEVGLPRLEAVAGFRGASMLMDRRRGLASVGVVYQDLAALEASRGEQAAIRRAAFTQLEGVAQLIALEEMEVVELDVPTPSA